MNLSVRHEGVGEHCLQHSPTPGYQRVVFSKTRAEIDRDIVDVPARGDLDLPCIIQNVMDLTNSIRAYARAEDNNKLWLYLSYTGGVKWLTPNYMTTSLRCFLELEGLQHKEDALDIFFRRLRPTAVADVALCEGLDDAQRRAGHADSIQTFSYAVNPTTAVKLRRTVGVAQSKALAAVRAGYSERPRPAELEAVAATMGISRGAAAEIILGQRDKLFNSCSDDANGNGPARRGTKCDQYEACLVCPNSLILERHLPRLIAYQNDWLSKAFDMNSEEWESSYGLNCEIIEDHLTKFHPAVVEQAREQVRHSPPPLPSFRFKRA